MRALRFSLLAIAASMGGLSGASKDVKAPPKPSLPNPAAVSAKCAILIDEISGKVLWSKNPDMRRYPASTTKIMTALLIIERCQPHEVVTAPSDIEKIGEASLHLRPGEQLSVKELLWGIMLRSANDGCVAAAAHCAGSVEAFCALMNERAKQIGCSNTTFTNPNGLKDPLHMTTARDLSLMAREAMKYPEFREIVSKRKRTIARSMNQADTHIISKNKFLDLDPTADGIKTGFTRPAGQCFVGSASRNGTRFITVVLGSDDWLGDTAKMINWGFNTYEVKRDLKAGEPLEGVAPIAKAPIKAGPVRAVRWVTKKGDGRQPLLEPTWSKVQPPIVRGQQIGMLRVTDADGWSDTIPLVALESSLPQNTGGSRAPLYVLGACLAGAWAWGRRQRRRMYARFTR